MALIEPTLPKRYKDGRELFESHLESFRVATQEALQRVNFNLTQIRKDCFFSSYDFFNDGDGRLARSLQDQINLLSSGGVPLSGTSSGTFTINTGASALILSSFGLTATRTFTFPDLNGVVVTQDATQTLTNKTLSGGVLDGGVFGAMPIGGIVYHYDFNGELTLNSTTWKPCKGQTETVSGIGSQTLPDLSGRYIVGFGTDGGADIDTATWGTAAVGNAAHSVNLQHSHTVNSHLHTVSGTTSGTGLTTESSGAHTHEGGSHSHGAGGYTAQYSGAGPGGDSGEINWRKRTIDTWTANTREPSATVSPSATAGITTGIIVVGDSTVAPSGTTSSAGAHTHTIASHTHTYSGDSGSTSPGTNNQLSATQSIQPRSIRFRGYMRVV